MTKTAREMYEEVLGLPAPEALTATQEFAFGKVWQGTALSRRHRFLSALVCIAWNNDDQAMHDHAYGAMATGELTIEELLEWVLHFAIYCGWPKASGAEGAITAAYDKLRRDRGEEVTPFELLDPNDANLGLVDWNERLDAGRETYHKVNLSPAPPTDTPYRNSGIVGFVFGHLWRREALSHRERRFITVPCVMVENTLIPRLSHVGTALASDEVSKAEMDEIIETIAAYDGWGLANETRAYADQAWNAISNGGHWSDPIREAMAAKQ